MVCSVCQQFENVGTFVTGCKNYKHFALIQHEQTVNHQQNCKKEQAILSPDKTEAAMALKTLNQHTISRLVYLFKNAHYVCVKGRPYTDYVSLCDLDQSKGNDIGTQYRTDKKAAEFSSAIAETERLRIRKQLSDAKYVSAISDGSTDSSFQEAEIVYVRSCQRGEISVHFSLVKNIPRGDAEHISETVADGLSNYVDNYDTKLIAVGCDGASVMLGNKSVVVQRLRETTNSPYIVGVHCAGHKLELAYKDVVKTKIALYDKIDCFLLSLYYFYRNSNLNISQLKESFKSLGQSVILPTRVGGTRWIGHLKLAISSYLQGHEAICQHLAQLRHPGNRMDRTDKANKAKALDKVVSSKDTYHMCHFLLDVLTVLGVISARFQLQTAIVSDIVLEIEGGIEELEKLRTSDGPHLRKGVASAPETLKGDLRSFESARRDFLDRILGALKKRFTENPGIIEACSVMSLSSMPTTKADAKGYGDVKVAALVDHFKPVLEAAGVEPDKIEAEWTKLKINMFSRFETRTSTWCEVGEKLSDLCPNLLSLVDLVLTMPASSADAERGFNRLKITKSDWRSKLSDQHLSDQLVIVLESPPVSEYDPLPAIHLWNETPRRVLHYNEKKGADINANVIVVDNETSQPVVVPSNVEEHVDNDCESDYMSDDSYGEEPDDYCHVQERRKQEVVNFRNLDNVN